MPKKSKRLLEGNFLKVAIQLGGLTKGVILLFSFSAFKHGALCTWSGFIASRLITLSTEGARGSPPCTSYALPQSTHVLGAGPWLERETCGLRWFDCRSDSHCNTCSSSLPSLCGNEAKNVSVIQLGLISTCKSEDSSTIRNNNSLMSVFLKGKLSLNFLM